MKMFLGLRAAILAGSAMLAAGAASAATDTGTMAVSANVQVTCDVTGGDMAFGDITGDSAASAEAGVNVTCTGSFGGASAPAVAVNNGLYADTTGTPVRRMRGTTPTHFVPYALVDGACSGNSEPELTDGGAVKMTAGDASNSTGTLCGKIAAGGDYAQDNYADTLTLTVTYDYTAPAP